MTDEKTTEELWQVRLTEARVQIGHGLEPERLAGRYGAESADEIEGLTKRAAQKMLDSRYGTLTLDDLDEAAEVLGIEIREPVTDGGRVRSSVDAERNRLEQRLVEKDQSAEFEEDENHAKVACRYCGGDHLGELYTSPPDGWYVRYYCVVEERRGRRSVA